VRATSHFTLGAAARATSGPAPRLLAGFALTAAWHYDRSPSIWSFAVQLVATTYPSVDWAAPGGSATFSLDAAALHLCPLRFAVPSARAALRLCASASAGRLEAHGSDTFSPRSTTRPFATAGGAALLAVTPHRYLELTASVEPGAALIRDRFTFDPETFYGLPRLIVTYGVAVAAIFP
jgi:hypothetical protein